MGRNANHFGGEMKKMWSGIKGIPSKLSSGWSSAKSSVGYHTKAIANSTGKWFGKAWQSVKSTTEVFTIKLSKSIQMPQIKLGRIQIYLERDIKMV
ncbi:putative tail length tape measure domain protein [Staphylococcus aureus]|nr:putative tail length tape measure domain protein [Staphylococcus aureus]